MLAIWRAEEEIKDRDVRTTTHLRTRLSWHVLSFISNSTVTLIVYSFQCLCRNRPFTTTMMSLWCHGGKGSILDIIVYGVFFRGGFFFLKFCQNVKFTKYKLKSMIGIYSLIVGHSQNMISWKRFSGSVAKCGPLKTALRCTCSSNYCGHLSSFPYRASWKNSRTSVRH